MIENPPNPMTLPPFVPEGTQAFLPPYMYGVTGVEVGIFFENIFFSPTPDDFQFTVVCAIGTSDAKKWTVTPAEKDIGSHFLKVIIRDVNGINILELFTEFLVSPADTGSGKKIRLLIVGDSLTAASVYPNELARLLSQRENPEWTMFGSSPDSNKNRGVLHEGYGGCTWKYFMSPVEPNQTMLLNPRTSPFLFFNENGEVNLDLPRYFKEQCGGSPPDLVTFLLGINDTFSLNSSKPDEIDARINGVMEQAESFLAAFQKTAPGISLAVCVTTPPNIREEAFTANYNGKHTRVIWKKIQFRLAPKIVARFSGRHRERIFLVPTQLFLDPVNGFPENDAVHPNAIGYGQIGAALFSWMKWWLGMRP